MSAVAALLALPVGAVFLWSGVAKTAFDPAKLGSLALADLIGRKSAAVILRLAGVLEVCVGGAILLAPGWVWPRWAAAAVAVGGALYATIALSAAPGTPCGCFGTTSANATSRGTVVRALSLAAAAGATLTTTATWTSAFASNPGRGLVVVLIEAACVGALFREELGSLGWRRWERTVGAHSYAEDCATAAVAPEVTMKRLGASEAWSTLRPHLVREQPIEQWREGCWRFVCFPATHRNQDATAVFAVRLPPDPPRCKGAIVIDGSEEIVLQANGSQSATPFVAKATASLTLDGAEILAGAAKGRGE
jgi:methylamine utilization protein MauE